MNINLRNSTNVTPNYQLPQYVASDHPKILTDFNNAMLTIDTAMESNKSLAQSAESAANLATQTANAASTKSDTAIENAGSAVVTANDAEAIAISANDNAGVAKKDATKALTLANLINESITFIAGEGLHLLASMIGAISGVDFFGHIVTSTSSKILSVRGEFSFSTQKMLDSLIKFTIENAEYKTIGALSGNPLNLESNTAYSGGDTIVRNEGSISVGYTVLYYDASRTTTFILIQSTAIGPVTCKYYNSFVFLSSGKIVPVNGNMRAPYLMG